MNIFIRTDASIRIGTGHIMRCITLADVLCEKGAKISFICREFPGNLCDFIENKGYKVYRLPYSETQFNDTCQCPSHLQWLGVSLEVDAKQTQHVLNSQQEIDWLIIDHYAIDNQWEIQMRSHVKNIMVIDDLADRPHDCDLILDQNYYENLENRYKSLVPAHCRKLLGPKYILLRPEFQKARKKLKARDGQVRRILIFFGGSDPTNETEKALKAVQLLNRPDIAIDVIIGKTNPHKEKVKYLCSIIPNTTFYYQVSNMAELMSNADLAIGAGGSTLWERCYLGLPTITLVVAKNQLEAVESVSKFGAIWGLGWSNKIDARSLANVIKKAIDNPLILKKIELSTITIIGDGNGIDAVTKFINMV